MSYKAYSSHNKKNADPVAVVAVAEQAAVDAPVFHRNNRLLQEVDGTEAQPASANADLARKVARADLETGNMNFLNRRTETHTTAGELEGTRMGQVDNSLIFQDQTVQKVLQTELERGSVEGETMVLPR